MRACGFPALAGSPSLRGAVASWRRRRGRHRCQDTSPAGSEEEKEEEEEERKAEEAEAKKALKTWTQRRKRVKDEFMPLIDIPRTLSPPEEMRKWELVSMMEAMDASKPGVLLGFFFGPEEEEKEEEVVEENGARGPILGAKAGGFLSETRNAPALYVVSRLVCLCAS